MSQNKWIIAAVLVIIINVLSTVSAFAKSPSQAPQSVQILIVKTMDLPLIDNALVQYQAQLRALMPDTSFTFTVRNAEASAAQAQAIMQGLQSAHNQYDIVLTAATVATKAAMAVAPNTNTQFQFMIISDPVALGIIDQWGTKSALPMTGVSHVVAPQTKLQLMEQILAGNATQKTFTIGLLHSDYPSSITAAKHYLSLNDSLTHFRFVPLKYEFLPGSDNTQRNRDNAISLLQAHQSELDGYWAPPGPASHDKGLFSRIQQELALPRLFTEDYDMVQDGALLGVLCDDMIIGRNSALQSMQILQGKAANELVIDRSKAFLVAVNIEQAIALDIVVPSSILLLADGHIYPQP
jgi:putative ABC transport system substrate-binding protein